MQKNLEQENKLLKMELDESKNNYKKLSLKIGVELPSSVISTLNLGKAALGKRSILQIHAEKKIISIFLKSNITFKNKFTWISSIYN